MEKFPLIELTGSHYEIGYNHGKILEESIRDTLSFYKKIFSQPEEIIFDKIRHFESKIKQVHPGYIEEINGIAEGANIDRRWILALNARSELITLFRDECTAIYSSTTGVLAQNWDWAKELEDQAVLMRITYSDGHSILMMTEPGIIGKIGLNSSGLGVTLNFLHADGPLTGLPIHITLRVLLDCTSLEEGEDKIKQIYSGKAGNIIFASSEKFYNFEFANTKYFVHSRDGEFTHTNHFLEDDTLNTMQEKLKSSFARHKRSSDLIKQFELTLEGAKKILGDQTNDDLPICRPYIRDEEIGNVGTVCSIIMDLSSKILYYTPGHPLKHDYQVSKLE